MAPLCVTAYTLHEVVERFRNSEWMRYVYNMSIGG